MKTYLQRCNHLKQSQQIQKLAFKVIHSTTSVLPAWDAACAEKGLKPKHIPRDVSTHWNSAFDMLDVAVRYNQVIENIMDKRKLALGKYAIDEHEWELLKQLHKVLKVHDWLM